MRTLNLLAIAALAFIITACCPCRRSSSSTIPVIGTEWKLAQLGNETVTSDNFRMTLGEYGRVTGVGDCNRFNGTFRLSTGNNKSNGNLSFGQDMVSTRMMCPNQTRETEFLRMLSQVDSFSVDGDRLLLIRGGNVLAIFDPAPVTAD